MLSHYGMNAYWPAPTGIGAGIKRSAKPAFAVGGEPAIEDILADEATLMVMARDGVGMDQLHTLMTQVRSKLL